MHYDQLRFGFELRVGGNMVLPSYNRYRNDPLPYLPIQLGFTLTALVQRRLTIFGYIPISLNNMNDEKCKTLVWSQE